MRRKFAFWLDVFSFILSQLYEERSAIQHGGKGSWRQEIQGEGRREEHEQDYHDQQHGNESDDIQGFQRHGRKRQQLSLYN